MNKAKNSQKRNRNKENKAMIIILAMDICTFQAHTMTNIKIKNVEIKFIYKQFCPMLSGQSSCTLA